MIVSHRLEHAEPKERGEAGKVMLSVHSISSRGKYSDVSFELRQGEIVGFAEFGAPDGRRWREGYLVWTRSAQARFR